jgi:hypothetical protein
MNTRQFEDLISETADLCSSIANRSAMMGINTALYLYYRPGSSTEDGALYWVKDDENTDGLTLADPEAYRGNLTRDQVRARVWQVAMRLPINRY